MPLNETYADIDGLKALMTSHAGEVVIQALDIAIAKSETQLFQETNTHEQDIRFKARRMAYLSFKKELLEMIEPDTEDHNA